MSWDQSRHGRGGQLASKIIDLTVDFLTMVLTEPVSTELSEVAPVRQK